MNNPVFQSSKWQPIETAPKDGTVILLYEPDDDVKDRPQTFVGCWDEDRPTRVYGTQWMCEEYDAFNHYPTHWMELPAPPEAA